MSSQSETLHDRIELSIGKPQLVISNEDILLVKQVREFLENNGFDHSRWPDEDIIHILREKSNPRMEVIAAAYYIMDAEDVPDQWVQVKSKKPNKSKEKKIIQENSKKNIKPTQNPNTQRRTNANDKSTTVSNKAPQSRQQPSNRKNFQKNRERPNFTKPNNINNNMKTTEKKPRKEFKGWESKPNSLGNAENIPKHDFDSETGQSNIIIKEESLQTPKFEESKPTEEYTQPNIQGNNQTNTKVQETGTTKVVMPSFDMSSNEEILVQFGGPISIKHPEKPDMSIPQPQPSQSIPLQPEGSNKVNDQNTSEKMVGNAPPGGFTIPHYMTPSQPTYNQMPFIPPNQGYAIHGFPFDEQRMNFFGFETYNQIPTYHMPPNNMNSNVNTVGSDSPQTTRSSNTQDKSQNTGKPNGYFNNGGNPPFAPYGYPYMNYHVIPQNTSFQHPSQYNVQGQSNQYMRYNNNSNNYGKQRSQYNSEDSYNTQ